MMPTLPSGVRGLHGQSAAGRQGTPSTTTRRAAPPDADGCSRRQLGEGAGITRLHLQRRLPGLRGQTERKAGHQISR